VSGGSAGSSLIRKLRWSVFWLSTGCLGLVVGLVLIVTLSEARVRASHLLGDKQAVLGIVLRETAADPQERTRHLLEFFSGHADMWVEARTSEGALWDTFGAQPRRAGARDWLIPTMRVFVVELAATPDGSTPGLSFWLYKDNSDDLRRLLRLAVVLALTAGAVVLVLPWAASRMVHHSLRPLSRFEQQVTKLTAADLSTRLDPQVVPVELGSLVGQFNGLLDRLAGAYEQLEAFNSDVAHELNTPLARMVLGLELALRDGDPSRIRSALEDQLEQLRDVCGMVQDMLFLSRADRGVEARREPRQPLAPLLEQVADFHEALAQDRGLTVETIGDACVAADHRLLKRALSNLLSNAIRHAETGSTVRLKVQDVDAGARFEVINRGEPIPPSSLDKIFRRFFRVDVARGHAETSNHGLGLAIVSAIARMHGGHVFAASDNGTTCVGFWISKDPR
jgi:two-component system heavy metal sensor histidine kinase CusS